MTVPDRECKIVPSSELDSEPKTKTACPTHHLFAELPLTAVGSEELIEVLASSRSVRIERIVSIGHSSPEGFWYDQDEHEWVIVLQGEGMLAFEHAPAVHLKPGDSINIPAHRKHRVEWTMPEVPTVWLAVFYKD